MPEFLFVYGSLRPGLVSGAMRQIILGLPPISAGSMPGRLYDLGPYPVAVVDDTAVTRIEGEVLALPKDPTVLAALDDYEGFRPDNPAGSLYRRIRHHVSALDGRSLRCWVYVAPCEPPNATLIPGGDYLIWRTRRHAASRPE